MFEQKLAELELRLAQTEKALQSLREQLHAAEQRRPRGFTFSLPQALAGAGAIAILVAAGLFTATNSVAQGPDKNHTIKAPFVVVDANGKPIMDVGVKGQRRLHLYDSSGTEVVGIGESKEGNGSATLIIGSSKSAVGLQNETGDKKGGFFYTSNGQVTARLGEVGLGIYDKSSQRIVHVGADTTGQIGIVNVGKAGKSLVQLTTISEVGKVIVSGGDDKSVVELGKIGVEVFSNGKGIAHLGHSPSGSGAGYLAIGNKNGNAVVEAGVLPEGDGVVRAYPLSGMTPIPIPNFIRGGKSDR